MECTLLHRLLSNKGMVVPKEDLKRLLWGNTRVSRNALDRKISRVRKILSELGSSLEVESIYRGGVILKAKCEVVVHQAKIEGER